MTRSGPRRPGAAVALATVLLALALAGCGGPRAGYAGISSTVGPQTTEGPATGRAAVHRFRAIRRYRGTPVPDRKSVV